MKEILGAPVYDDTPLQTGAQRFLGALGNVQKIQLWNEEGLEQHLWGNEREFFTLQSCEYNMIAGGVHFLQVSSSSCF